MEYIFEAVLALGAAIITYFVVPMIRSKTDRTQRETIAQWVDVAVAAAEQVFDTTQGAEKLAYVVDYLEKLGIRVTHEEIESAVYWLHSTVTGQLEGVSVDE